MVVVGCLLIDNFGATREIHLMSFSVEFVRPVGICLWTTCCIQECPAIFCYFVVFMNSGDVTVRVMFEIN